MSDVVAVDVTGGVMTLTMQDQPNRNSLTPELVGALRAGLDQANADADVRVVVITNSSRVFCSGANLKHQSSDEGRVSGRVGGGLEALLVDILDSPTPVIGRIAGHALGGGVGLAAACDVSIADKGVRFGFTEVRLGLAPAIISVVCLPKMSRGEAMEAFLRGNQFDGDHAADLGLVNRAVPTDQLDATVESVVDDILRGGPSALTASKSLVRDVPTMPTGEAFAWTAELSAQLFASDEGREGMAAFLEKRDPDWTT